MNTALVLARVGSERMRQDAKWGTHDHCPASWLAILGEEYGETCKAALEKDPAAYLAELIHVAAVAVAAVEAFYRPASGVAHFAAGCPEDNRERGPNDG